MLVSDGSDLIVVGLGGWVPVGCSNMPLVRSCKPVMINLSCFNISTSNLVKMATQFSSQSCPMEMRESVVISLKTWVDCALEESLFDICKVAHKAGLMMFPLAT